MRPKALGVLAAIAAWLSAPALAAPYFPTPTGAAGSPSTAVVSVQGVSSGTPIAVTAASGSTTAVTQATAANLNAQVVGPTAHDSAYSGNGVNGGCFANSTAPVSVQDGDDAHVWCSLKGAPNVVLGGTDGSAVASINVVNANGVSGARLSIPTQSFGFMVNGSGTWDQAFTCNNVVVVNVTAGNTTEIVASTAAQVIRVCSVSLGISASGTVGVVYGTGTNCGTGTATLNTDMNLTTGTLWQQSAPSGGALFRTAAANALCIKAVTGNVVGSLTYAKF